MALHLVTGYAGEAHITSADQGTYNMGTFGEGEFVLNRGAKFAATIVTNNQITIADGEAMMQGRYIKMTQGTSEDVAIDNGTVGMKRNDLICLRYERDLATGEETATFVVKKGTESSTTPSDPSYTQGVITDDDDAVNEMPLYRVGINGINIEAVTTLFAVKVSMVEYMTEYQMPVASSSQLGAVKIGSGINVSNGTISVTGYSLPTASSSTKGGVKVSNTSSNGLYMNGEGLYLQSATSSQKGGIYVGTGLSASSGTVSLNTASSSSLGGVKVGDKMTISSGVINPDNISYGTSAKTSGSSSLTTGTIYCQYE